MPDCVDANATRRVVVCADDFASGEAASRAIAELAAGGRLGAVSAMVLSPRWPGDAALLEAVRGAVDVGLHLDFTSPFARAAGWGRSLPAAMLRSLLGGFDRTQARQAIDDQLDRFEAHWRAPPDHVDGHQHVQQFAGIREALVQALAARYPGRKPWLRVSQPGRGAGLKGRVIAAMGARALQRLAGAAALPCSPQLSGLYDFTGDEARYAALVRGWLARAADGTVVMCHPALAAEPGDPIGAAREREYRVLAGPGFAAALAAQGIALATGTSLFKAAA